MGRRRGSVPNRAWCRTCGPDPLGEKREVYTVLADSDTFGSTPSTLMAAVVEWDTIAQGGSHPAADDSFTRLYAAHEDVRACTDAQKTVFLSSFDKLDSLGQARTQQLAQAQTDDGPRLSHHLRRQETRHP